MNFRKIILNKSSKSKSLETTGKKFYSTDFRKDTQHAMHLSGQLICFSSANTWIQFLPPVWNF